jgi:PAS domain S-box-containing protein
MRDETEFLTTIVDTVDDGIYYVDQSLRIIYWNKGAERITGYSPGDVLGRRCSEEILGHVDGRGVSICTGGCSLARTMDDGIVREMFAYFNHKSGQRVPTKIFVSPIRNPDGSVIGAMQVFSDDFSRNETWLRSKEIQNVLVQKSLTVSQAQSREHLQLLGNHR